MVWRPLPVPMHNAPLQQGLKDSGVGRPTISSAAYPGDCLRCLRSRTPNGQSAPAGLRLRQTIQGRFPEAQLDPPSTRSICSIGRARINMMKMSCGKCGWEFADYL